MILPDMLKTLTDNARQFQERLTEWQAIDHRGVGLQAHPLAQAVHEDAGDLRAFVRLPRLLLDDRGHDQRLLGRLIGHAEGTRLPFLR